MIKGGLLRYASCQNPHNHQVAAVLASPRALHSILLSSSSPGYYLADFDEMVEDS